MRPHPERAIPAHEHIGASPWRVTGVTEWHPGLTQATSSMRSPPSSLRAESWGRAGARRTPPASLLPQSSGDLWEQPLHPQVPRGGPHAGYWPFLPPRPLPPALLGAALAPCPPGCEVLPEGVPGEAPARRLLWSPSKRRPSFRPQAARATGVRPWVTLQLGQETAH